MVDVRIGTMNDRVIPEPLMRGANLVSILILCHEDTIGISKSTWIAKCIDTVQILESGEIAARHVHELRYAMNKLDCSPEDPATWSWTSVHLSMKISTGNRKMHTLQTPTSLSENAIS